MAPLHSLLKRQIKRYFGQSDTWPKEVQGFVDAVNEAYWQSDDDRGMLERSLELNSQELLTANSEMRAVFQAFPDLYFRLDAAGTILEVKAETETDMHSPSSQLLGKRIQDIPEKSAAEEFARAIDQVRQTRSLVSIEYSLTLAGAVKHFEARLVPLLENQILVIVRNITETKRAEEALREAEAKYRRLVEQLPGIAYTAEFGERGRWHYVSPQINTLLGFTAEEWQSDSTRWYKQVFADDREHVLAAEARSRETGAPFDVEYRILTCDGRLLWIRDGAVVVNDETGQPRFLHGIMRDITDARQLQDQLRQAQKMEAIGRLAGGVAHDFNNLLTVISGHCGLLVEQMRTGRPTPDSIEEIQKAAERASQLTRQLLAFSRKQVLQPKVLDLNDVVAGMEKMARRLIGEDVELRTVLKKPLGRITADPGQMEQVVLNLVVNARDAMPRGGRILIETDNVTLDQTSVVKRRELEPGEYVMLAITDNGIGMTEGVKAHLFEPFFTTKGPGKGTGLGLATCFGIVRQSGGDIRVYSEPDRGTTFRIYFPKTVQSVMTETPPAEIAPPRKGTETLLLIEDDVAVRRLTTSVLRSCGYIVHEAGDGVEGLQLISGEHAPRFDLVISDVTMPRMGGKEVVENIRLKLPELKVLFISGYTNDALTDLGTLGPGISFLEKPFSPKQLAQRVRAVLDEPSALLEVVTS